jgi:16S rRNA (cytidine1402-2'-O)-methyltransferase
VSEGVLYLVPTPLGDERDLSPRAAEVLAEVDLIAAEDTRITLRLLQRLNISKRLVSYHDHNESSRAPWLLERLKAGQRIALVSDAGTPLVSDPGYRVVQQAAEAGVRVVPLPGPGAAIAALTASGLPTDRFSFIGFLPREPGPRRAELERWADRSETLIFYEPPHRLIETLRDVREVWGDRRASLAFNLTKEHEAILRGSISQLLSELESRERVAGEITAVVAGAENTGGDWRLADALIGKLLAAGLEPRAVRDIVSQTFDLPKRGVYERVLAAAGEK